MQFLLQKFHKNNHVINTDAAFKINNSFFSIHSDNIDLLQFTKQ